MVYGFCIVVIYAVFCIVIVSTTTTFIFFSHLEGADKSAEKEDDTTREFRTSFGY
jgi:uncharacterized membrane protein